MALDQNWLNQSHLHGQYNNLSKFQPSKANGLGGVRPSRSKNAPTLYIDRLRLWCRELKVNPSHARSSRNKRCLMNGWLTSSSHYSIFMPRSRENVEACRLFSRHFLEISKEMGYEPCHLEIQRRFTEFLSVFPRKSLWFEKFKKCSKFCCVK